MKYIYFIFFTLLLILGWMFGIQNAAVMSYPIALKMKLLLIGFESIPIPLGAALILAFISGMMFTLLGLANREIKLRRELRAKNLEIRHAQVELNNLRQQVLHTDEPVQTSSTSLSA